MDYFPFPKFAKKQTKKYNVRPKKVMAPYPNQEKLRAAFEPSLLFFLGLAFVVLLTVQLNFYHPTTFTTVCEKTAGRHYSAKQNGNNAYDSNHSKNQQNSTNENDTFENMYINPEAETCYEELAFPITATIAMLSNLLFAAFLGFSTFKVYESAKLLSTTKNELELTDIEKANLKKDYNGNLGFKNMLFIFTAFSIFGFVILFTSLFCQGFHFYIAKFYLSFPISFFWFIFKTLFFFI